MAEPTWRDDAACRGHDDADWWFSYRPDEQAQALRVCADCPVAGECLAYAADTRQEYGVWGGVLEHHLRRRRRRTA